MAVLIAGEIRIVADELHIQTPSGKTSLTRLEAELLTYLAGHIRQVVSKQDLLSEVWGYHPQSRSRAVDFTVRRLRRKIEPDPSQPVYLKTVRGAG